MKRITVISPLGIEANTKLNRLLARRTHGGRCAFRFDLSESVRAWVERDEMASTARGRYVFVVVVGVGEQRRSSSA